MRYNEFAYSFLIEDIVAPLLTNVMAIEAVGRRQTSR